MRRGCFPDECLLVGLGDSPPLISHLRVLGNEQNSCHSSTKPSKQPHGNTCKRFSFRSYKDFFARFPVTTGYFPTSRSSPLHPNRSLCARKKKRRHLAPMRLSPWKLTRAFIRHPEPRAPRCASWTPRKAGNGGEIVGDTF